MILYYFHERIRFKINLGLTHRKTDTKSKKSEDKPKKTDKKAKSEPKKTDKGSKE